MERNVEKGKGGGREEGTKGKTGGDRF